MFSVQEDETEQRLLNTPNTAVYIGWEPAEFLYKGEAPRMQGGPGSYEFDGPLLRMKFETIGFEAHLGVGGKMTGIDEIGYFDAGVKAIRGISLVRSQTFQLQVPLQLRSSINTVSNNEQISGDAQFRQATMEFGGGGKVGVRLGQGIRFTASAIPSYGFSFATGGIFGGQIYELETQTRFYVDRLFGQVGLSAGWDYGFKRFDVDDDEFDYNFRSHSFLIGLTF
ncbi:MAG: hypothetical protein U5K69_13310 [Balneolaceae bacterium]|nr:hypothetical protein [Balneolaceae bacterium]